VGFYCVEVKPLGPDHKNSSPDTVELVSVTHGSVQVMMPPEALAPGGQRAWLCAIEADNARHIILAVITKRY
jgi:hypothetical protein